LDPTDPDNGVAEGSAAKAAAVPTVIKAVVLTGTDHEIFLFFCRDRSLSGPHMNIT